MKKKHTVLYMIAKHLYATYNRIDPENTESSETRLRHIGLVVLRGPSIILVSPTDGSEEIENPFVQAE
ncbi:hypothetical protein GGI16_006311 [Coemansia sp. S142-1]|nr:hypothetical protein GGI16_006311 [Coemansia sp. S142-1]